MEIAIPKSLEGLVRRKVEEGRYATEAEVVAAIEVAMRRFAQLRDVTQERDNLALSLENRKILDRAKGLLQARMSLSEPEAFRWIQKAAMDRRLSVREVADTVIAELGG